MASFDGAKSRLTLTTGNINSDTCMGIHLKILIITVGKMFHSTMVAMDMLLLVF